MANANLKRLISQVYQLPELLVGTVFMLFWDYPNHYCYIGCDVGVTG